MSCCSLLLLVTLVYVARNKITVLSISNPYRIIPLHVLRRQSARLLRSPSKRHCHVNLQCAYIISSHFWYRREHRQELEGAISRTGNDNFVHTRKSLLLERADAPSNKEARVVPKLCWGGKNRVVPQKWRVGICGDCFFCCLAVLLPANVEKTFSEGAYVRRMINWSMKILVLLDTALTCLHQ
jgi:hypothetical protein